MAVVLINPWVSTIDVEIVFIAPCIFNGNTAEFIGAVRHILVNSEV